MPETKQKSALSVEKEELEKVIETPSYTDEQKQYLSNLQKRLEYAQKERDKTHEEFDGMTYLQYWLQNERWGNTYIKPRKNKTEITFQSGVLRTKMFSFVSSLIGLNLFPDIIAYDENDILINSLGNAMEDIIDKTHELESDEEKQLIRIYELLKQGTIFAEEIWFKESYTDKELIKEFDGKFSFNGWKQKTIESTGQPVRNLLSNKDVYLGSLKEYFIENQPYIFTVETKTYEEGKNIYGNWEMWEYVSRKKRSFTGNLESALVNCAWTLFDHPDGEIEIIRYQDVIHNEYQILINGIPMLPLGYPLPWGRRYNTIQQNLEPIRKDFAYGKSFIFKNKNTVELLDEMIKMASLKIYNSFMPPYLNTSDMIISPSVLTPGRITMGVPAGALQPVSQQLVQGVTTGEFNMLEYIKRYIDENTASQTFTGMREQGTVTATQIIELQRQARIMLGVIILATSLMEKKLATARLMNILQNWFDPIDTVVDKMRGEIKNRYRIVSRQRSIENKGPGIRFTIPSEREITPEQLMEQEEMMGEKIGKPVRMIIINPKELKQFHLIWVVVINPREKKSSELNKLMFKQKIADAIALGLPLNMAYIKDQFAEVWGDDPGKLFEQGQPIPAGQSEQVPGQAGTKGIPQNIGGVTMKKPQISMEQAMRSISEPKL